MKWFFKFSLLMLFHISAFGQTPEKMSYQAVIRDNNGILLENSNVNLKIVLRQGSPNGAKVYEETHNTMTNKNGLLSLEIGSGQIDKGRFNEINWSKGPFFIETHVDPKGNSTYKLNGISQLLSVPYALHAKAADSFTGTISPSQLPDFYTADEIDDIFLNIATEVTNTSNFSGDYRDLENKPLLFSGRYSDLQDKPEIYSKTEIDNLIEGIEPTGVSQHNLYLEGETLSISDGNSISFGNWDTNAADDFSGRYNDLQNKPELYSKTEIDNLIRSIETTGGSPQNLNLEGETLSISGGNAISFSNWDTNAADDFSGSYEDLQNKPILFSGLYTDLQNKPELYSKTEIDNLIQSIETTGGSPQNLNLEGETLSISGGNAISFSNWDINAADDFSGSYDDLQNKPVLFSGQYADLQNKPELYSKAEINNLIQGIETTGDSPQNLNLEGEILTISSGNSISFRNWDTNAADDFTGSYDDLQNKPVLFSGQFADLQNKPELYSKAEIDNLIQGIETTGDSPQNLNLEGDILTISGGNSISFLNWDTNASDDFNGEYTSLTGTPKVYTQEEVDAIKAEILVHVKENYSPKARVVSMSSSRNVISSDVGNTLACISSATLTITSEFSGMQVGDIINLEVHGTTLTITGGTGVVINGISGGNKSIGNNEVYTGGLIRKIANNSYIVL